jgi:hypothetical protein
MQNQSPPVVAAPGFGQPDSAWNPPNPGRTPAPATATPAPAATPAPEAPADSRPSSHSQPPGGPLANLLRLNRRAGDPTRTGTSLEDGPTDPAPAPRRTPVKVDAKLIEDAAGALIGVAIVAGVWAVRARYKGRRTLRRPDDADQADAAEALGRILHRRAALAQWAPDLIDACILLGAAGNYANRGPLTTPLAPVVPVEPIDTEVDL